MNQKAKDYIRRNTLDLESDNRMDSTGYVQYAISEAKAYAFIIDADINTPSMNTEFEGDHPHEMIWVHSSGNMFSKFIYLEKSMVRQYLELAKKKIHSINPDYVLIDTPPSVTNVHIELLSRVKVSYVLFVTQPTKLSNQDVLRTMDFFHERCGKVNCGIVENMCYGTEHNEYPIRLVAQIPMQDNMNTENLLTNAL